ncbi:MAG: hypothetical protein OXB84_01090 [Halobacteriovoraceae bacterium]|nr:hypothetical protein [Halobacteriovoraceae bacterium]
MQPNTDSSAPPCCQTGCPDCPYGYGEKVDPEYPAELQNPWKDDKD